MDTTEQAIQNLSIGKIARVPTPSGAVCVEASLYLQGHRAYARQERHNVKRVGAQYTLAVTNFLSRFVMVCLPYLLGSADAGQLGLGYFYGRSRRACLDASCTPVA